MKTKQGNVIARKRIEAPPAEAIAYLAKRVIAGGAVTASLNDGTFVLLMEELRRRGWVLQPRAEYDPERRLNAFVVRVKRDSSLRSE